MRFARRAALASATMPGATGSSSAIAKPTGTLRESITPYRAAIGLLLLLLLAFYMWTAGSSVPFSFSSSSEDVYNQLTTAFLHGHTYLPITPPPGLLHLRDPYNPVQNAPYNSAFHDLVLYHGHFYSQWGPTPVVTLFAPFRITGLRMSESFAVALYAFVGLVCSVLLLEALITRLVPSTPRWLLVVATVGLGLTNALPFLLRRPVQYEVAISSGYCFEMAGLWLMVTSVLGPGLRRWRMLFGSLCLGLAVGGRPTLAIGGTVALAAGLWEIKRRSGTYHIRRGSGSYGLLAYALGPFVVCCLLLAWYNHVRFGGFTNFGERYELAGVEQTKVKFYSLSYILPGLFAYLLVPARLALTFPHAFLGSAADDPFGLYKTYAAAVPGVAPEPTGGVLTTMPITLVLLALPALWWRKSRGERRALFAVTGLTAMGLLIVVLVSWALFGTTERYEVDFVSLFLIPAFLTWAIVLVRFPRRTAARRFWAAAGVVLTLIGVAIGTAVSFTGYSDLLRLEHPAVFDALEDVTGPLATLATVIRGKPELARIDNGPFPQALPPTGPTEAGGSAWLGQYPVTLVVLSPGSRHDGVTATVAPGPGAPPPSALTIRVSSPGRKPLTVPVIAKPVRLPISLHWGLNRVRLTLVGRPSSSEELELTDLQLSSS